MVSVSLPAILHHVLPGYTAPLQAAQIVARFRKIEGYSRGAEKYP